MPPPNQRSKSRFLNIEILVHWGVNVLIAIEDPGHPDKKLLEKYCAWIRQHKGLIERLKQFDLISQKVRQHIREHGICRMTGDNMEAMLELLDLDMEACQYSGMVIDFFHEQSKRMPFGQIWIGSSEIIESLFGKLKNLESDQSKGGFTTIVLAAAACVGKVDAGIVTAAMEQVTISDVDTWMQEQIGMTITSKRRKALGDWKKNNSSKKSGQESTGVSEENAVGF